MSNCSVGKATADLVRIDAARKRNLNGAMVICVLVDIKDRCVVMLWDKKPGECDDSSVPYENDAATYTALCRFFTLFFGLCYWSRE